MFTFVKTRHRKPRGRAKEYYSYNGGLRGLRQITEGFSTIYQISSQREERSLGGEVIEVNREHMMRTHFSRQKFGLTNCQNKVVNAKTSDHIILN